MLDQVETMFDGMETMLKKLKTKSYEENMKVFREKNGHFFDEMRDHVSAAENRKSAAEEVADVFVGQVRGHFLEKGKIRSRKQADLNFFMIYYVFPAILLMEGEESDVLAGAICKKWGETFKDSKIGYTTYEKIYDGFNEKVFGLF